MTDALIRRWQDLTTVDFADLDQDRTIVVLPVAAIEQHGPHLPLSVDAVINESVIGKTMEKLPAGMSVLVLPPQTVGWSDEHGGYPGTLSLSSETLTQVWCEIGANVARAGFRKLVLFNSHGGQSEVTRIVARKLRISHGMLAVAASWYALVDVSAMFEDIEHRHGIHGGAVETSIMLYLRPDLVRKEQIGTFEPASVEMEQSFRHLGPSGRVCFGWETQDLHPSGAIGDAAAADAEKGRAIVDQAVDGLLELLDDVDRFDLSRLKPSP